MTVALSLPNFGSSAFGVIGALKPPVAPPPYSSGILGYGSMGDDPGFLAPGAQGISNNAAGVRGTAANGYGIHGVATDGLGVVGESTNGVGILALSSGAQKYALVGSGTGAASGVLGVSQSQFGVAGVNTAGNTWAGAFFNAAATAPNSGKKGLVVQGDFVVVNGTKNAAVKTQKHGYRKMYAVEATENVFEDFGTAKLQNGRARVELEEVFAETVNTGQKYQVYLTPTSGDSKGLGVVAKDPRGFTIQELGGGTGSYEIDYRVVAKVRGYEGTRMEAFEPPVMPTPPPPPATPGGDENERRQR